MAKQKRSYTHLEVVQGITKGDPIKLAFEAARRQAQAGKYVSRDADRELFFRAGYNAGIDSKRR